MELFAPGPARDDEPRFFENAEMFHDTEARHRQFSLKFTKRLPVAFKKQVQQKAARRIAQCFENPIIVEHGPDYM